MLGITFKDFWSILKEAASSFMKDKVPKLSASLAYYTIFSLGPMLIVVIYLANFFYGRDAIEGRLFGEIRKLVGDKAALQIQEILQNATISGDGNFTAIIGSITLLIAATTVFAEIQDTLNMIWKLRIKPDRGWWVIIRTRLLSFSLVVSLGFLLLVSLIVNSLIEGFMDKLKDLFPSIKIVLAYLINLFVTLLLISSLFGIIFKVLPDAVIKWKDVAIGALFTALLFMLGKFGITFYIGKSKIGSTYGTAGSLVILMLWVYYSSIILYFGAEFTKAYAMKHGSKIRPNEYAVTVQLVRVDTEKESIQENEDHVKRTEEHLKKK